ncbi:hypothetical protein GOBAR_AA05861 [Gossypium barbadense]|uniref:Cytochrome P450 n=1 Tax=Gossypium barbadense TaxID=3634 RepID=A0A2P5YGQ7_GOSBA|nr:hypothetical protein GOBAR_AA05861 [Gossypium barbadense]
MGNLLILFIASLGLCLFVALLYVLYNYWWVPHRVQFIMSSQGIRGPPYEFTHGNNKQILQMQKEAYSKPMALTHDIFPRVLPHVYSYIKKYGKNYLSWNGVQAQLVITDPELQGDSLVTSESEKRARQRKLANYAFHGESLKNMIPAIIASVETMLEKWKGKEGKEMEVFQEFGLLTSEMISRTAFSSSYLEGEKIFDMLMKLSAITGRNMYKAKILFIGKFWEPADEIESDKLAKMIHDSVMKIIKQKEEKVMTREADNFGRDFLGLLLNAYHDPDEKIRLSIQYVVGECKSSYFAGQKTSNSLLAWTILLLAINADWQDKARAEVIEVFGNQNPNSQGIAKLKIITMIINETLRLYPPVHGVLSIRYIALHHDPDLWGDDVHLFKPERFAEGIAKATYNNAAAFLPFGLGPRSCVGMSFSITKTKIPLSMILQRYTFTISPSYVHAPLPNLSLKPQHGLHLLFHSLH